jgi:hypothetical protein
MQGTFPVAPKGSGMAEQGQVVGFGGSAGEHHALRCHLQRIGDLTACKVYRSGGGQPASVLAAGRIAPLFCPEGRHRIDNLSSAGRGGLEIEVER